MSYESFVMPGVFALRWGAGARPEMADIDRYVAELTKAHEVQGQKLVAVFVMPKDHVVPDEAFRKAQASRLPDIMACVDWVVAVFEGVGFVSSIKRSALAGILMLAPQKYPIHVRASIEEALLTKPPGPMRFDPKEAIQELKRQNIC